MDTKPQSSKGVSVEFSSSNASEKSKLVLDLFSGDGLLIRSVQTKNLWHELTGETQNDTKTTASKRNWSLMSSELKDNYYKMGPETGLMPRDFAVLASPHGLSENVIGIYETDQASSSSEPIDKQTLSSEEVMVGLSKLKSNLVEKQKSTTGRIDNSEIQTLGLNPKGVVGLLFYPSKTGLSFDDFKDKIQRQFEKSGSGFHNKEMPIFEFSRDDNGLPRLKCLGSVTPKFIGARENSVEQERTQKAGSEKSSSATEDLESVSELVSNTRSEAENREKTNSLLGEYRFGKYAPSEFIPHEAQEKYTELHTKNEAAKEQAQRSSRTHATSRDPDRSDIVDLRRGTQQADAHLQDVRDAKVGFIDIPGRLERRSAKREAKQEVRVAHQRQGKWERAYTEKYREEIAPHKKTMESAIKQVMAEHGAPIAEKEREAKQNANSLLKDRGYGTYSSSEAVPPEAQELFRRLYEDNEVAEKRAHQSARASAIRADKSNSDIDGIREDVKRATANIEAAKSENDGEGKKAAKEELREAQRREEYWGWKYGKEFERNIAPHKKRMDSELKKVMTKYGPPEAEINRVSRKLEEALAKGQENVKYYTNPTTGEIRLGGYNGADTEIKGKVEDVLRENPHYPYAKEAREAASSVSTSLYSASKANLSQYHREKARQEGEAYYQNQQAMKAARRQADDEAYKARNEADYQQRKAIKEYELAASIAKQEHDAAVREYQKAEKAKKASQSQETQKAHQSQAPQQKRQAGQALTEDQKAALECRRQEEEVRQIIRCADAVQDQVRPTVDKAITSNAQFPRQLEQFITDTRKINSEQEKISEIISRPSHIAGASTSNIVRTPDLKLPDPPNVEVGDRIRSGGAKKKKVMLPS
ncbi:hypothetical protein M9194_18180 [Vibrio sp. S4M6]|uniref:hypothetical protein n=1 Tax=Vibrio sinus TaxID=2946865 RepID=UPI002029E25F|nr:hypothetical protein [Vibrio sinus]MCL9783360.1 hypothetical protein [Vibrio sinus]